MVAIAEQNVNVISLDNIKTKIKIGRWERKNRKKKAEKGLKKKHNIFMLDESSSQLTKGKEQKRINDIFSKVMKELKVKLKIMM